MLKQTLFILFSLINSLGFAQQLELSQALPMDANVRTGKLPNGLTYFLYKNNLPEKRAELRLVLKAGSVFETDEEQGLAHFTEHLCFNGTKHFPKDSLIQFIESVGMKFGAHLNASTGFEETIYQLSLPTDKPEIMEKGLQVIEDWAHEVSFEAIEIEKERGVVISERRNGLGAGERMQQQWFPILYKDSRYADRLPIGKLPILETFKAETLRDFYKKWYRPNLMAICIAGDIDVDALEKKIQNQFSKLENPTDAPPFKQYGIPDHNGLRIVIASDEEATQSNVTIFYKRPFEPIKTVEDNRRQLCYGFSNMMLNSRFGDLIIKGNTPYTYASSSHTGWMKLKDAFSTSLGMKETDILKALNAVLIENERVRQYGFTAEEFFRAKKNLLASIERSYNERDKRYTSTFINGLVNVFLNQSVMLDATYNYQFYKKYIAEITLDEINVLTKESLNATGDNATLVLTMPKKEGLIAPTEMELRQVFDTVAVAKISPWKEDVFDGTLMENIPNEGSIISEKKNETYNFTEWKLSNGAKVIWKATDFKNDQVSFAAFSSGGYAKYPVSDDDNGAFSATMIGASGIGNFDQLALKRLLAGKNFSISPYISERSEGLKGSYINKDAETFFQALYLVCTAPRKDETVINTLLQQRKVSLMNRSKNPESNFRDSIGVIFYDNHPRRKATQVADLEKVDLNRMLEIYKDRFANMGDFTFVFVGNIDPFSFRDFVELYIASLPTTGKKEKESDPKVSENIRPLEKTFYGGKEPRALIDLNYYALGKPKEEVNLLILTLADLLEKRLREILREEKSGTYGVNVIGAVNYYPKRKEKSEISISFSCAPEKVEELIAAADAELKNIAKNGINEQDLHNIQESYLRKRETNLKENSFWLNVLTSAYRDNRSIKNISTYEARVKGLSPKKLQKLAQKHFQKGIKMQFVLMPKRGN